MEDVHPLTGSGGQRSSEFADVLGDGRRRAHEFFIAQQNLLDSLEGNLLEQLKLAGEQLAQLAAPKRLAEAELARGSEQIAHEAARLAAMTDDLLEREAQLEDKRVRLEAEQNLAKITAAELEAQRKLTLGQLTQAEGTLADSRKALEAERTQLAADRQLTEQFAREQQDFELEREAIQQERTKLLAEQEQLAADRCALKLDREEALTAQAQASRARERLETEQRRLDGELDQLASDQAAARMAAAEADSLRQQTARLQERVEEDRKQLEALRAQFVEERIAIQTAQEEAAAGRAEVSRTRERLEAERQQLAQDRERLSDMEAEAKNQRRRIAREFQVQRATHIAELERRRSELQAMSESSESELASQLAAAGAEAKELREQAAHLRKLLNARAAELTELRAHATQLCNELESLRQQHDKLTQELAIQDSIGAAGGAETARLRQECAETARQLAASEERTASTDHSEQQGALYEMQRRFELAIEDLRDFKRRNAELEVRLSKAQAGGASGAFVTPPGGLDWESQKRRLLASLAADDEQQQVDDDPERREERLTIESTICISDEVVAQKDREIAALKQLLDDQASSHGSVAVNESAIAAILDQDELIRQEREKLAELQRESQETLRQAEISISLERATIARYRAEIEEKLACHQANLADHKAATDAASDTSKSGKPTRGRWLARLGLKDLDE